MAPQPPLWLGTTHKSGWSPSLWPWGRFWNISFLLFSWDSTVRVHCGRSWMEIKNHWCFSWVRPICWRLSCGNKFAVGSKYTEMSMWNSKHNLGHLDTKLFLSSQGSQDVSLEVGIPRGQLKSNCLDYPLTFSKRSMTYSHSYLQPLELGQEADKTQPHTQNPIQELWINIFQHHINLCAMLHVVRHDVAQEKEDPQLCAWCPVLFKPTQATSVSDCPPGWKSYFLRNTQFLQKKISEDLLKICSSFVSQDSLLWRPSPTSSPGYSAPPPRWLRDPTVACAPEGKAKEVPRSYVLS